MALVPRRPNGNPERRRRRWRGGDLAFLSVVLVLAGAIILHYGLDLFDILYSPTAGFVAIIMIVEYLLIKSSDMTRVFRIENDELRKRRRRDEALLRKARELTGQALLPPESEEGGRPGDWQRRAKDFLDELEERL